MKVINKSTAKVVSKFIVSGIAALFIVSCGGNNKGPKKIPLPHIVVDIVEKTLPQVLSEYMGAIVNPARSGMSVIVRKNDEIIFEGSKGMANSNHGIEISTSTGFRLASVSKTFTALAIMQLWESGLIKLDDQIGQYLPQLSNNYQRVTIEQLLTHTSGIPDFINDSSPKDILALDGMTNKDLINFYQGANEFEFQPGTSSQYSNTGYLLLSEIVEVVSNMPFGEYMHQHIFAVAGMDHSYIIDGQFPVSIEDALSFATNVDLLGFDSQTHGSSGQVSSVIDLSLFFIALKNHSLITEDTFNLMKQRHIFVENVDFHYGYGWIVLNSAATKIMHTGGYDGFQTIVYMDIENDFEFAILTNGGARTLNAMTVMKDFIIDFLTL